MRLKAPTIFCDEVADGRPCLGLVLAWAAALALAGCGGAGDTGGGEQGKTLSATASAPGVTTYTGGTAAEAEALARVMAQIDESLRTGVPVAPPAPPVAAQ